MHIKNSLECHKRVLQTMWANLEYHMQDLTQPFSLRIPSGGDYFSMPRTLKFCEEILSYENFNETVPDFILISKLNILE